ncbi:hypothetical protein HRbin06_00306 [archaeon HR06]|nr:hypothetical protein HRbin06_00306 [archaeon HR06]
MRKFVKGGRISCAIKGLIDGGLKVPVSALPDVKRVEGEHIQNYARELKEKDEALYLKKFSKLLAKGLKPENYVDHFHKVKEEILRRFKNE